MTREEAIEIIRDARCTSPLRDALETLIPELAESEDERIRRWIKKELEDKYVVEGIVNNKLADEAFAWLEKQKEPTTEELYAEAGTTEKEYIANTMKQVRAFREKQKEQKPILEVSGFKVGDAVRLKDGDGRKHIIKSIEEVEGIHGPNFYHVEFEDNSARDGIYPGEEYPNGYYTQMVKVEEEQKPAWSEEDEKMRKSILWVLESYVSQSESASSPSLIASYPTYYKEIDWLKSLRPQSNEYHPKSLALDFINYLDANRPEGRMCVSNMECDDIVKAFTEHDWAKISRYANKYQPHWKPSEDEERLINTSISFLRGFAYKGYMDAVECIDWLNSKLNGNSGK